MQHFLQDFARALDVTHLLVCLRESGEGCFVFGGIARGDDVRRSRAQNRKNLIVTLRLCGIRQCVACILGLGELRRGGTPTLVPALTGVAGSSVLRLFLR